MKQVSGYAALVLLGVVLPPSPLASQTTTKAATGAPPQPGSAEVTAVRLSEATSGASLPEAPGVQSAGYVQGDRHNQVPDPCGGQTHTDKLPPEAASAAELQAPCAVPAQNPYKRFLDNGKAIPLSPRQKAFLAYHDIIDPFNLLTIVGNSAFTVGINPHNDYGPGLRGFGRSVGYSFLQDATGEVIGTFGICSLFHEDPHYHRMPSGRTFERVVHAISRTVIAQHDDGTPMPNYEVLITYPASAEITNLYVPGVHGNAPSTVARVLTGLATDPINNIITEFLPDFAKHFHVRVVFLQQIINQVASREPGPA